MKLRRGRGEKGQSLAEFSMILPIFLIVVFGIIDFGMGLRAYITVAQATREGARFGAVGNAAGTFTSGGSGQCDGATTTTVVGKVCSTLNGLALTDVQSVTVTCPATGQTPPCNPGDSLQVSASYRYHYITPLRAIVNVLSGGSLSSYIPVSSTTTMRQE